MTYVIVVIPYAGNGAYDIQQMHVIGTYSSLENADKYADTIFRYYAAEGCKCLVTVRRMQLKSKIRDYRTTA